MLFTAAAAAAWLSLASIQAQTAPSITQQPTNQAVEVGSNATLRVTVAGTGPFFYRWLYDGSNTAVITTVAGDGTNGSAGNGVPATNALLFMPVGVTLDNSGNLYISDFDVVAKVGTNGILETGAGNGSIGYSGDGGAATNAELNFPGFIAVDPSGSLYIPDSGNNRVRKVGTTGVITTIAGIGTNGYSGDGGQATNAALNSPLAVVVGPSNVLYIADSENNRVRKVGTNGIITTIAGNGTNAYFGDGGKATNASLSQPVGLALDASGNLYIADSYNFRIRKVGTNGIITTVAGNGAGGPITNGVVATNATLGWPEGLAVDTLGNLYFADKANNCVAEVSPSGLLTIVAGFETNGGKFDTNGYAGDGGPAIDAALNQPSGIAVDASGDLFIADTLNARVREVTAEGPSLALLDVTSNSTGNYYVIAANSYGSVTSFVAVVSVGTPPSLYNQTSNQTVFIGSTVILAATSTNAEPLLYEWQFNGTNLPVIITTVAGNGKNGESGDGGKATNAEFYAGAVAVDALGDFFIADSANARVREINASGIISTVAGNGTSGYSGNGGPATNAQLFNPAGVAVDGSGNLYIADEGNQRVRIVATNGFISTLAGTGSNGYFGDGAAATNASLSNPSGVAVDAQGNIYIADTGNNRIRMVGTNGVINTIAGNGTSGFAGDGGSAAYASLSRPAGVAVDGFGNVFIADSGNFRVRKVFVNGLIITVAGNGDAGFYGDGGPATNAFFEAPASVTVDGFGNLYIADGTEYVREVGVNGIISTVAGNAGLGFAGDGGPATNSMLGEVYGLAADAFGDLYIADTGNNRIREMVAFGPFLALNGFNSAEAGNYDAIVSNAFGSVTSAVMVVTAELAPVTLTASLSGNKSLILQFTGTPGSNYVLQVTTNLAPPALWQSLATNAAGTNGSGTFTVAYTNLLANPASFYRLLAP